MIEGDHALTELLAINELIGAAESAADSAFFETLLHDRFIMGRPGGMLATRSEFLAGLNTGAQRRTTMQQVELHGRFRATARCRVETWAIAEPDAVQVFDDLRVFLHADGRWQLIAWLAEPA